ncbi:hypothetical protein EKPJFOCH_1745 [Methylobacterium thuringiense]|uniref:Uncharacterized protein n=1 Tax=Methylobacterium thuringiense TaxID=1003091 RepID=A0ABQ4TJV3_9HYPH|nr:hypothetical protein EKPJFOCH_1745 [Methylobacterium thuringiense]
MGVFAVIGLLVGFYGLGTHQPKVCFLALMLFGLGVAADTHGY